MRLEEILKIENGIVSGRDLHSHLYVRQDFTDWIKKQLELTGASDDDFSFKWFKSDDPFKKVVEFTGNTNSMVRNGYMVDYSITVSIAKEICMITGALPRTNEETKKLSKEYRKYFIQAEKQLQEELINKIKLETENEKLRADNLELELQVLKSKSMKFTYKDKRILTDKLYPILRTLNVKEKLISECHDFVKYNLIGKYENITEDADFSEEDFINKYRSFAEDMKENKSFYFEDKETYDLFYYMNNL